MTAGDVTRRDLDEPAPRGWHVLHAPAAAGPPFPALWEQGKVACLWLLIGAAALNGLSIPVHGLSVYPEYLALGAVLIWAAAAALVGRLRWRLPATLWPLLLWLAAELLATVLHAPDRHQSLILWVKLPLMVATYLAVANLARGRILDAVGAQCVAAAAVALLALGAYVSWRLTGSHLGMQHPGRNFGESWLPDATLREPNILGSYLLGAALLALPVALRLRRGGGALRALAWAALCLSLLGVAVSGARTAWLALLAGLCLPVAVRSTRRPGIAARRALLPLAAVGATALSLVALHVNPAAALPVFNPHQNGDLVQRVASFGSLSRDRDIVARVEIAQNALRHWQTHPLIGWGVGAYGEVYTYPPPDTIHPGWISNLPIHLLYDSGILGLAAFAWAVVVAAKRGIGAWLAASGLSQAVLAGLLLALFGLLLAFQATEATWFAYPWIFLGLLEAAALSAPARRAPRLEVV